MRANRIPKGSKQTVSLTITATLMARARALRINASRIAEEALAREVARIEAERVKAEVAQDLAASNAYAEQHGSFAEMAREHYAKIT